MARAFFTSLWAYLKKSIWEFIKPRNLAFYGITAVIFSVISFFLPYEDQV